MSDHTPPVGTPVDLDPADLDPADLGPADLDPVDLGPVDLGPAGLPLDDHEPADRSPGSLPRPVVDQRLRAAIESSPVGTALLDGHGRAVYVNDASADILGARPEVLVGMSLQELVHRDDRSISRSDLLALQTGAVRSLTNEWRLQGFDGDLRWIRTHLSTVASEADDAVYLVQLEDVTERHRLEGALRRSEAAASAALDALEQGVVLADSSGRVHRVNRAAGEILAASAADFGQRWRDFDFETCDENGKVIPIEERPLYRAAIHGEVIRGERITWRRPTGEQIMVRLSCVPGDHGIEMEPGAVGLAIAFTEITETRQAERLLDATLETAPVGLALVDAVDGSILRCNPAFARQMGRPVDELVGSPVTALLGSEDRPAIVEWASGIAAGETHARQREQRVERPDGTEAWLDTKLALIDDVGSPVFIAASFDVTERRRLMSDLERFSHLFEHANDLITVISPDGRVKYASPSHERMLGYRPADLYPDGVLAAVHPDDRDLARAELGSLVDGATSAGPFAVRVVTATGEWRHLECVAVNLLHEPSVSGIVLTSRDTTERERLIEQLAHRVAHDLLTELPNRALYETRLAEAIARADRAGTRVGLCYVDLDDFKAVNDSLGHHAGDQVLVEVAERLRGAIRAGDTAARIGGDEFVVVLDPVADVDEAVGVARRIRDALVDPAVVVVDGGRFGASVGIAVSEPGESAASLQGRADHALYRAKARGYSAINLARRY